MLVIGRAIGIPGELPSPMLLWGERPGKKDDDQKEKESTMRWGSRKTHIEINYAIFCFRPPIALLFISKTLLLCKPKRKNLHEVLEYTLNNCLFPPIFWVFLTIIIRSTQHMFTLQLYIELPEVLGLSWDLTYKFLTALNWPQQYYCHTSSWPWWIKGFHCRLAGENCFLSCYILFLIVWIELYFWNLNAASQLNAHSSFYCENRFMDIIAGFTFKI